MTTYLQGRVPLSLGFCIGDALQNRMINVEKLHKSRAAVPMDSFARTVVFQVVLCFEFQQTEAYQSKDWAKGEASASLKSPRGFLRGVAQQGAGLATSGDWTGVFHLSTEPVLCFQLQCRPAPSTLPVVCLHPDLEGPAKGEKVSHSPCPSHAYLVNCDRPCMPWTVLSFSGLEGKPSIHGRKPTSGGSLSTQHSQTPCIKFQDIGLFFFPEQRTAVCF